METQPDFALLEAHPKTNEPRILELIYALEGPLLEAARAEYPEKEWRMCGPTSIVVGHLLSTLVEIPLESRERPTPLEGKIHWMSNSGPGFGIREYLEIRNYIYLPTEETGQAQPDEHTLLLYHTGQRDEVIVIDPVYKMLWGEQTFGHGTMVAGFEIACRTGWDLSKEMVAFYNLHRFSDSRAKNAGIEVYIDGRVDVTTERQDMLAAMHDGNVFNNTFVGRSGTCYDVSAFWGDRLCRVMDATVQALPPHLWQP